MSKLLDLFSFNSSSDHSVLEQYNSLINFDIKDKGLSNYNFLLSTCYKALSLLETNPESDLIVPSNTQSIENILDANGVRYRKVIPEGHFESFDFGVLIGIPYSEGQISEYNDVLYKVKAKIYRYRISANTENTSMITLFRPTVIQSTDYSHFLEVYASLPFSVKSIPSFLSFIFREFKIDVGYVIFFSLLGTSLQLVFPSLTVYVTSNVVALGDESYAYQIGALSILLGVISTLSLFIQSQFVNKLETESDKRAQTSVWDRLMKLELSELAKYTNSDLMLRASAISQIRTLLSSSNIISLTNLVSSFIYIIIMYGYSPNATIAILPLIAGYMLILLTKANQGSKLLADSLNISAELSGYTYQYFSILPELKARDTVSHWESGFVELLTKSQIASRNYRLKDNSIDLLSKSFQSLAFCISLAAILSSISIQSSNLSVEIFSVLGYTSALALFSSNLSSGTTTIANSLVNVLAYWKRSSPLVFAPIEQGYNPTNTDVLLVGSLNIVNLSFSYAYNIKPIFDNLCLNVEAGKIHYLDWKPGAGSSTLFNLCLGLYPALQGHIYFDNHSIDTINVISLRRQVSLAPQALFVPFGALGEIFSGPFTNSDEDLVEFLQSFSLAHLVEKLRMGLDTPIPPGAGCFSIAQRQLLSLANSVSRKPTILLIDNCMSALTIEMKQNVFDFLRLSSITTIVAGNIADSKFCDTILQ